jgi:hypothetical protein
LHLLLIVLLLIGLHLSDEMGPSLLLGIDATKEKLCAGVHTRSPDSGQQS